MKKLKQQYRKASTIDPEGWRRNDYPYMRSWIVKELSTQQELSFYVLHKREYKDYPLKLRVARGTGLANPWDDLSAYVAKVARSWKHNSRRRHQYYKEKVELEVGS